MSIPFPDQTRATIAGVTSHLLDAFRAQETAKYVAARPRCRRIGCGCRPLVERRPDALDAGLAIALSAGGKKGKGRAVDGSGW